MGDLVNLNKFRKAKQRRSEETQAGINREKFGRTKAETKRDRKTREGGERALDGSKLPGAARTSPGTDAKPSARPVADAPTMKERRLSSAPPCEFCDFCESSLMCLFMLLSDLQERWTRYAYLRRRA